MSEWTVDTLREHTEALFASADQRYVQRFTSADDAVNAAFLAQKTAIDAALAAADRAVAKAETAAEKRFEGVNEFRAQLADQQRTLMPRAEADIEFRSLREKLDALLGRIEALTLKIERADGKGSGLQAGWLYLIGGIGLIGSLVGIASLIITYAR